MEIDLGCARNQGTANPVLANDALRPERTVFFLIRLQQIEPNPAPMFSGICGLLETTISASGTCITVRLW